VGDAVSGPDPELIRLNVVMEEAPQSTARAASSAHGRFRTDSGAGSATRGTSFGLVVDKILDIVEDRADVKSAATGRPSSIPS